jgi:hypothetical protein
MVPVQPGWVQEAPSVLAAAAGPVGVAAGALAAGAAAIPQTSQ